MITLPLTGPIAAGAKETAITTEAPGATFSPFEIPLTENPAPAIVTFEIVTLEPLVFVNVTTSVLAVPTLTFPKLRAEVLGLRPEITLDKAECEAPTVPLHPD